MSEPDGPAPRVRASDAEREQVADTVRRAVGDGRLTLVEGDERLASVYGAVHRDELTDLTRDLEAQPVIVTMPSETPGASTGPAAPGGPVTAGPASTDPAPAPTGPAPAGSPVPRATGHEPATSSFSLMHGTTRQGAWAPGPEHSAAAIMGGVELDLRHARLDPQGTTIRAVAIMGGIVITVAPDVVVQCEGVGVMGGFADQTGPPTTSPPVGAPPLKIVGLAIWGGVEIKRRERDEPPPT